ncbi:DUF6799 domain-containing protein [Hymenobacter elongatus]|uniref:DUF6799 domain-containing protein n=1 Tax=Hymenobacter elongatus TaxID=877208 RepID=A0A4Z0PFX9_9BACT|nr:DUF6799 domain-containing protein [Hymenobacter elongatus]TGE13098.1 hypothetical protein E5J99_19500 [Hymenobacter elongatus]
MYYVFLACFALGSALLPVAPAVAQTQAPTTKAQSPVTLKDGVMRRGGITMRLQAGESSRLSAPLTMENGLTVRPDGIMIGKDGSRQMLPEGKAVNMQGVIVNFTDDMMSAPAIEQHARQVTGAPTETRIAGGTQERVSQQLATELLRTERRLTLLLQLSDRLAERTAAAIGQTAGATTIDASLKEIDSQLRR